MNPLPASLASAGEVRAVSGPGSILADVAGGEVTAGSTRAIVVEFDWLGDERRDSGLGFVSRGGMDEPECAVSLVPIGTVSRGGLTAGGMAPGVVTLSVAGDMRPDRWL